LLHRVDGERADSIDAELVEVYGDARLGHVFSPRAGRDPASR
jgi:hypothetical protein